MVGSAIRGVTRAVGTGARATGGFTSRVASSTGEFVAPYLTGAASRTGELFQTGWSKLPERYRRNVLTGTGLIGGGSLALGVMGSSPYPIPEGSPNRRPHKDTLLDHLGGAAVTIAQSAPYFIWGAGILLGLYDVANITMDVMQGQKMKNRQKMANYWRKDMSPFHTERAVDRMRQNMARMQDNNQFIGNEARYMAARGV